MKSPKIRAPKKPRHKYGGYITWTLKPKKQESLATKYTHEWSSPKLAKKARSLGTYTLFKIIKQLFMEGYFQVNERSAWLLTVGKHCLDYNTGRSTSTDTKKTGWNVSPVVGSGVERFESPESEVYEAINKWRDTK